MIPKTIPQDLDAELCVLQNLVASAGDDIEDFTRHAAETDFTGPHHKAILRLVLRLHEEGVLDVGSFAAEAIPDADDYGGIALVTRVGCGHSDPNSTAYLAKRLRNLTLRRTLMQVGAMVIERAQDLHAGIPELRAAAEMVLTAVYNADAGTKGLRSYGDVADEELQAIARRSRHEDRGDIVSSGIPELDDLLAGGFRTTETIVVGARPAMGKSALGAIFAIEAARRGEVACLFSMEMSMAQNVQRGLARMAGVPLHEIRKATNLRPQDFDHLAGAVDQLRRMPLYIDAWGTMSVGYIRTQVRAIRRAAPGAVRLVVVDYVQLMQGDRGRNDTRAAQVGAISRGLKLLAMDEDVAVVILAQLGRQVDSRDDHVPLPSDLKESGDLEQDADTILFPVRPEKYDPLDRPGALDLHVKKARMGREGRIELRWLGEYQDIEGEGLPRATMRGQPRSFTVYGGGE